MFRSWLARAIYEIGYYRLYGKFNGAAYYRFLQRAQWNSLEANRRIQGDLLLDLLQYAASHIPYYRRIFREKSIRLSRDTVFDDLRRLPILTKDIIRSAFDELHRIPRESRYWWYYEASGGSTGEPIRLIQDNRFKMKLLLVNRLFDEWAGCRFGEKKVKLWGSERDIFEGGEDLGHRVANRIKSLYLLNSFRMDNARMHRYVELINRKKPKLIFAYAQSINELAKFIEANRLPVRAPQAVMTSAGVLYPSFRETIERVFRCPVLNSYGSREVGDVACECTARQGLHVSVFTHYLEILDRNLEPCREGEAGEIYVTVLSNHTMPLLRYRIGDMAVYTGKACSCGRGLPLIRNVIGRNVDLFVNAREELIDGEYFTHLFYFKDYLKKFQVIQQAPDDIRVKLVLNNDHGLEQFRKDLEEIKQKILLVMGSRCNVAYEVVDEIPPTPSGKYRYTIRAF
jgi:phenylacetate-CoA ligase